MAWKIFFVLLLSLGIGLWVLRFVNEPRRQRDRQWWSPVAAVGWAVFMLWLAQHFNGFLGRILRNIATDLQGLFTGPPLPIRFGLLVAIFNVAGLLFFALIKLQFNWVPLLRKSLRWLAEEPDDPAPSFAYQRSDGASNGGGRSRVTLKPQWVFPGMMARYAAVWTLVLPLIGLVDATVFDVGGAFADMLPVPLPALPALPVLLVVPSVLLLEVGWYLNGLRPQSARGSREVDPAEAARVGDYRELWERYQGTWPAHVLAASAQPVLKEHSDGDEAPSFTPSQRGDTPADVEIQRAWDHLLALPDTQHLRTDSSYFDVLDALWKGKDVLIEDAVYDRLAPVLFEVLHDKLMSGEHLLVLVTPRISASSSAGSEASPGDAVRSWIAGWFERLEEGDMAYQIDAFRNFRRQGRSPDLLVASADEILSTGVLTDGSDEAEWFEDVDTMLVLDATPTVFRHLLPCRALLRALRDQRAAGGTEVPDLQTIVLADDRWELQSSLQQNLPLHAQERTPSLPPPEHAFVILWATEGQPFQNEIYVRAGFHLGDEPVLALLALEAGVRPVRFLEQTHAPVREYAEELYNYKQQLRGNELVSRSTLATTSAADVFEYAFDTSWLSRPRRRSFALVRDHEHNCVAALRRNLPLGEDISFVHVASPPYLLRDYLAANVAFFLRVDQPMIVQAPRVTKRARASAAHLLLERLVATRLEEEVVRAALVQNESNDGDGAASDGAPVEDALQALFEEAFGIDVIEGNFLQWETPHRFIEGAGPDGFQEVTFFWLRDDIKSKRDLDWTDQYEITSGTDTFGTIARDHLYQTYLPGQQCAFEGKPYEIDRIDRQNRRVEVHQEMGEENCIGYRPALTVEVESAPARRAAELREMRNWKTQTHLYEGPVRVSTDGYLTLYADEQLFAHDFTSLTGRRAVPDRSYRAARMARLSFQPRRGEDHAFREIEFTLSVLLREAAPTLFPETHDFLIVAPRRPHPAPGEPLSMLAPDVHFPETSSDDSAGSGSTGAPPDESVTLYFIEDSHADLGLAKCLFDEWDDIFEVLEDYLCWLLDDGKAPHRAPHWRNRVSDPQTYLRFGQSDVPEALHLEVARDFLREMLPGGHGKNLHRRRRSYYEQLADDGAAAGPHTVQIRQCDFCGRALPDTEYETLRDGRARCDGCAETAVDTEEEILQAYNEARAFLEKDLGIELRSDIHATITDAQTLHRERGEQFTPTPGFDKRFFGYAQRKDGTFSILVENGQPYHMALSTLVHEMTHIWQYDQLDYQAMKEDEPLLVEGLAMWTGLGAIEDEPRAQDYIQRRAKQTDEYGEGYRYVCELLEEHPGHDTPFALLKKWYPPS